MAYLTEMALRLAGGALRLPESLRVAQGHYLRAAQAADGGFAGRQGGSDPYYTGFALRALALVGDWPEAVAHGAAAFLRQQLETPLGSVDFLSLVFSSVLLELTGAAEPFAAAGRDRAAEVSRFLDRFRCNDGGYAKTEQSGHSSTYHTFLATACQELVGLPIAEREKLVALLHQRQRADGGFVELAPLGQSGTNPTAAAIGTLRLLDALDPATAETAAPFLASMQNAEGGLRANGRIPVADLLSTFTGMVALGDLGRLERIDLAAVRRYVESLASPDGGFRGGSWDQATDVEYTFYGLGALALLESVEPTA